MILAAPVRYVALTGLPVVWNRVPGRCPGLSNVSLSAQDERRKPRRPCGGGSRPLLGAERPESAIKRGQPFARAASVMGDLRERPNKHSASSPHPAERPASCGPPRDVGDKAHGICLTRTAKRARYCGRETSSRRPPWALGGRRIARGLGPGRPACPIRKTTRSTAQSCLSARGS